VITNPTYQVNQTSYAEPRLVFGRTHFLILKDFLPYGRTEKHFPLWNIGSPEATPKTMQAVNTDADFLTRHASQIASRFHHPSNLGCEPA
jgi:hypothetical protein